MVSFVSGENSSRVLMCWKCSQDVIWLKISDVG